MVLARIGHGVFPGRDTAHSMPQSVSIADKRYLAATRTVSGGPTVARGTRFPYRRRPVSHRQDGVGNGGGRGCCTPEPGTGRILMTPMLLCRKARRSPSVLFSQPREPCRAERPPVVRVPRRTKRCVAKICADRAALGVALSLGTSDGRVPYPNPSPSGRRRSCSYHRRCRRDREVCPSKST